MAYEAHEPVARDIATIEEQLALPPNAKYEDLVFSARMFDRPASSGGWHPRPPHTVGPHSAGAITVGPTGERRSNLSLKGAPPEYSTWKTKARCLDSVKEKNLRGRTSTETGLLVYYRILIYSSSLRLFIRLGKTMADLIPKETIRENYSQKPIDTIPQESG